MRKKSIIIGLEEDAKEIKFPKHNDKFEYFSSKLKTILGVNCGYAISKTLEYDSYDQLYYVVVENSGVPRATTLDAAADKANLSLSRTVSIDPRLPLQAQIEHINCVALALERRRELITFLLDNYKN